MSKNKILQPKIRFKEFSGENAEAWEQRKLGEIADGFDYGLNVAATEYDGENKYIRITDIDDVTRLFKTDNLTSPDADLSNAESYKLSEGDILFARTGASVGKTYKYKGYDGCVYFAGFLIRAKVKPEYNTEFVFQNTLTNKYNKYIQVTSMRSGQPGVNAQEYQSFETLVPRLPEQDKIGSLFKCLDETLTLHQRKLETLESLKKTLLSKMFPKNGKAVPELRFAGFTDNWEQRKASELFKSISDKNHPNLPVLSASQEKGMILRDDIGIDIKYDHKSLSNYKRVTPGQFVIHLRSFQGGFADSQMEGITSPAYTVIDFKEKDQSHSLFWKEILTSQSFIKRLETVTYGIRDGRSISFSDFSTLKFIVPKLDEQEKIAVLFKILNQTITLHQRKIEQYQELKKTLLSKMFI